MKSITAKELSRKMQKEELNLIDVRETEEFADGHVAGAVNLPLSSLERAGQQLEKEKLHYVICQKGGRSARACQLLEAEGYQVVNVEGGVEAYPLPLVKE